MTNKKQNNDFNESNGNIGVHIVVMALMIFMFLRGCQHSECNPVQLDSFNWLTATCSRDDNDAKTFSEIKQSVPVMNNDKDWYGWHKEEWFGTNVKKTLNEDGSFKVEVTAKLTRPFPKWLQWIQMKRKVTFPQVQSTPDCPNLVPNDDKTGLKCIELKKEMNPGNTQVMLNQFAIKQNESR